MNLNSRRRRAGDNRGLCQCSDRPINFRSRDVFRAREKNTRPFATVSVCKLAARCVRLATAVLAPMSSGFEFDARRLTRSRVSVYT